MGFRERWNITSNFQMLIILIVFAITGSTSAWLAKPVLAFLGVSSKSISLWLYIPLYLILIFPIYQVLLLTFGFVFGQIKFFWAFEKKMLRSMRLGFLVDWTEKK